VFYIMNLQSSLEQILRRVEKPGRYTGGEWNSIVKDWQATPLRVALCFPDVYEIGMSNLGLAVLYDILNRQPNVLAERVYAPWPDMQAQLRQAHIPLYSLENKRPLSEFDLIGFSLPYDQLDTNVLTVLDLGSIPLRAADRDDTHPIVIAGGHATFNPEPMSDFIDAFVIGEGEEVILDIASRILDTGYCDHRSPNTQYPIPDAEHTSRDAMLRLLASIPGVYVPRFYDARYNSDGTVAQVSPTVPDAPKRITKRIVPVLPPPPTRFIVPFIDITHNRAMIEIMRGCTRGCRYCHAGFVTRPVRERPVEQIVAAIDETLRATGYEEVGLLSLSSSDYSHVGELVEKLTQKYAGQNVALSLPSLRIDSFSVDLADALKDGRHTGFTFAPEAATEAQRRRINKFIPDQQVLDTARQVFQRGWRTIKLYFMIGHPDETLDDVQAIVELSKAVLAEGRKVHGKAAQVNIGCATFIPKPHTPFQWTALDSAESIQQKQSLLKSQLRRPGLKLNWVEPEETILEAFLSRGDRRLGRVILRAWQLGAQFDAWSEHFNPGAWRQAFAESGLDPAFYTYRPRALDEVFPWDHIDTGVRKKYLQQDYEMSQRGEVRPDCRDKCFSCGILPAFNEVRAELPLEAWGCPPVGRGG
jgi:radical SAM family uncharacterized protein